MNRVYRTLKKRFVLGKMRGQYMSRFMKNRYYTSFDGKQWLNKEIEKINSKQNGSNNNDDDNITSAGVMILAAICMYNILPPSPPSSFA
jgi:hypothetical protein